MKKPSVSKLLDLLNKPALVGWANKIGLEGISLEAYRAKSQSDGTNLHNEIMDFCKSGKPLKDPSVQKRLNLFLADKKILAVEEVIETDDFQGRLDVRIEYEGVKYVVDYKSNSKVYFETILQLMAYRMKYPDHKIAVVHIPEFKLVPIEMKRIEEYETILKCLSLIYECKYNIEYEKI